MYVIEYSPKSIKQLNKLPFEIRKRIKRTVSALKYDPYEDTYPLENANKLRATRIGDYRALVLIKDTQLIVLVVSAGHRKHIYDKI